MGTKNLRSHCDQSENPDITAWSSGDLHVGDDVVESETHESESRPPDSHNFAEVLARKEGSEAGQAY